MPGSSLPTRISPLFVIYFFDLLAKVGLKEARGGENGVIGDALNVIGSRNKSVTRVGLSKVCTSLRVKEKVCVRVREREQSEEVHRDVKGVSCLSFFQSAILFSVDEGASYHWELFFQVPLRCKIR